MTSWAALAAELGEWRAARRTPQLWWRDDDATALTPPLERLLKLSRSSGVTVAIAAIPLACEAAMLENTTCVLMHGCDHRNRAAAGEKKTEFAAAESDDAALERLAQARERLARLAGERFLAVLAPPWNRIRESLVARLPEAGLQGLSRYGARRAGGFREVNTHVDLIAWRGDRRFIGEDEALELLLQQLSARRRGKGDAAEPTGILTHHALHDAQLWLFLERLFEETRRGGAAWPHPAQFFASPA